MDRVPRWLVRRMGKGGTNILCLLLENYCKFVFKCARTAECIQKRISGQISRDEEAVFNYIEHMMEGYGRQLVLALFACDLSGNLAVLYEQRVFLQLISKLNAEATERNPDILHDANEQT